jgi:hypothetical protein
MLQNPLLINKSEIKSNVLDEKIVNLLDKTFRIPPEFSYNVVEIGKEFVARMDILSKRLYGTDKYQDVLCKLNGISNPFELNEGDIIICPEMSDLAYFYYLENPSERDPDSNEAARKPVAKDKKEKRKPNEAVIGDKRYKVDQTRKVIIY